MTAPRMITFADHHRTSTVSSNAQHTLESLAKLFAAPAIGSKEGACWLPAHIPAHITGGNLRNTECVRSVGFLVLDIEADAEPSLDEQGEKCYDSHGDLIKRVTGPQPPSIDDLAQELAEQNWACLLHTSYSHQSPSILPEWDNELCHRYRLTLGLSRPLLPQEVKPLAEHVSMLLGLDDCIDRSCMEPARLFFMPRTQQERLALYECKLLEGEPLDVDALLLTAAKIEAIYSGKTEQAKPSGEADGDKVLVIEAFNQAHDLGALLEAHGYKKHRGNRYLYQKSTTGIPGVFVLKDGKRVISQHANDPLCDGKPHDAFDLFCTLAHTGDRKAAIRAAAELLGLDYKSNPGTGSAKQQNSSQGRAGAAGATAESMAEASAKQPAEPVPLLGELEEAAPYPLDALPPVMREAVEAIAYYAHAPLAMAGQTVIGAAAYLAQSRINAPHHIRQDGMPCSLFQLTLGNSGDRKSECHRLAFKRIHDAEHEERKRYKADIEQLESTAAGKKGKDKAELLGQAAAIQNPQTLFSDATFEPIAGAFIKGMPAACWDTDEGGQMLGGASIKADTRAQLLGNLTKLFDSGSVDRTRAASNLEAGGFAYHRRLCVHLLAQEVAVSGALSDPLLQGQGLLPRFMLEAPTSLAGSRFLSAEKLKENPYLDQHIVAFWNRIEEIQRTDTAANLEGEVLPPVMPLAPGAEAIWLGLYNDTEAEQGKGGDYSTMKPFAGRAGELARRLAAVVAFFAGDRVISSTVMEGACNLVRHSLGEWLRFLHKANPPAELVEAQHLLEWLQRKGWETFESRDLLRHGPRFARKSSKKRDQLLGLLVEHGWLSTTDGKQFHLRRSGVFGESGDNPATARDSVGDNLATGGDKTATPPPKSQENTDLSPSVANVSPTQTQQPRGLSPETPKTPLAGSENAFEQPTTRESAESADESNVEYF